VEAENSGAIKLYDTLGFRAVDTVQLWESPFASLRNLPVQFAARKPDDFGEFRIRSMNSSEWEQIYELDIAEFHTDLNWPDPLKQDSYKKSLTNWWDHFMSGLQRELWVVADTDNKLIGFGSIENEWARPHKFKVRVTQEWQGRVERPLLAKMIRRVRYLRRRPIQIEHLSRDFHTLALLQEAGLRLRRTLMTMKLEL
jgi:ribosomal protein S18 acetylase RimI-like enzyme